MTYCIGEIVPNVVKISSISSQPPFNQVSLVWTPPKLTQITMMANRNLEFAILNTGQNWHFTNTSVLEISYFPLYGK